MILVYYVQTVSWHMPPGGRAELFQGRLGQTSLDLAGSGRFLQAQNPLDPKRQSYSNGFAYPGEFAGVKNPLGWLNLNTFSWSLWWGKSFVVHEAMSYDTM